MGHATTIDIAAEKRIMSDKKHLYIPITTLDYQRLAEKRLPGFLADFVAGGANDENTVAANQADFRRIRLRQRVLRNVDHVDTTTTLAGQKVSMPLALAPCGMAGIVARRGEVQAASAAAAREVPFSLSTLSMCGLQEVQGATGTPVWFQLYMLRDREIVQTLLARVADAGCTTLIFTVDLPVAGARQRDFRNGMRSSGLTAALARLRQIAVRPGWAVDVGLLGGPRSMGNLEDLTPAGKSFSRAQNFVDEQFDPTTTWNDIAWLRSQWKGRLIIKGLLEVEDARSAADAGADGVIVSNHGGRQLDGVASSISRLPVIVAEVGQQLEVYMDGGVRSGIDVIRAVALGARGVFIGRPWIWAIAARGRRGLEDLLDTFQKEIATAMALMGVTCIEDITPDTVEHDFPEQ